MIVEDGFYLIPLLPKEMAARLKDKPDWPSDLRAEYKRLHATYTASKAEFATWVRRDRDSRMNRTAKQILLVILDCLNFDTGRCDPGHQFIADELGISVRTVERTIPRIASARWITIKRRGRTTTNSYRFQVPTEKVAGILEYVDGLREQRAEERARRRLHGDPTEMSDHSQSDPTNLRSHEPTEMSDHDPTEMAGKPMKGTFEDEPAKKDSCSEGSESLYGDNDQSSADVRPSAALNVPYPVPANDFIGRQMVLTIVDGRDVPEVLQEKLHQFIMLGILTPSMAERLIAPAVQIPDQESEFNSWITRNIPDRANHREAYRLLRERKMTPEVFRRLAA